MSPTRFWVSASESPLVGMTRIAMPGWHRRDTDISRLGAQHAHPGAGVVEDAAGFLTKGDVGGGQQVECVATRAVVGPGADPADRQGQRIPVVAGEEARASLGARGGHYAIRSGSRLRIECRVRSRQPKDGTPTKERHGQEDGEQARGWERACHEAD